MGKATFVLIAISLYVLVENFNFFGEELSENRQLSKFFRTEDNTVVKIADADGKKCRIPLALPKSVDQPVIVASYPGSGAKLTWKLVRAITGIMTGDDHDHNGLVEKKQVATIKTHYPSQIDHPLFEKYHDIPRSILLLRNPVDAIPSLCNFIYEQKKGLPGHSTRTPLHEWQKWRDTHFEKELKNWVATVNYWMENYSNENRLIVHYEHLIDGKWGPKELQRLGRFLDESGIEKVPLAPQVQDYPCVWNHVVRQPDDTPRNSLRRKGTSHSRFYTSLQVKMLRNELRRIREKWPEELGPIMNEFLHGINDVIPEENMIPRLLRFYKPTLWKENTYKSL